MRIVGVHGSAIGRVPGGRRAKRRAPNAPAAQSRALIAIEPPAASSRQTPFSRYPAAPFLAHLIASQMQLPQTRVLRRAEPAEVIAVYEQNRLSRIGTGRLLSQSA